MPCGPTSGGHAAIFPHLHIDLEVSVQNQRLPAQPTPFYLKKNACLNYKFESPVRVRAIGMGGGTWQVVR
ncbi:hypothetical protein BZL54_30960 [Burkholderia ubonensis subsp. mesacidophila]|uniref:Uncharacterized protein n=1 Tax=Burkholderia ubonensis subsp. mesacidophila TaxID=265293 RepID=A0A2A4F1H1_9BURK|nr:hypothetical protein BZL54_30960 [Burkholderia ubonensis subsp. mesacidophila]